MTWAADAGALDLLEHAGPFERAAYRSACVDAFRGAADVSYGASLADGTRAAVALVRRRGTASLPYGYSGVRASRALGRDEARSFLRAALRASRAHRLIVHDISDSAVAGEVVTTTSLWPPDQAPEQFTSRARRALRRAAAAGATCEPRVDPGPFWRLYEAASRAWRITYPLCLIAAAAEREVALFFDVDIDGRTVGSVAALRGEAHWMYWLGAMNDEGRSSQVGYLGIASMLEAARAAGAGFVNLGASAGLPGVAEFKASLGGRDAPVYEWREYSSTLIELADRSGSALWRLRGA